MDIDGLFRRPVGFRGEFRRQRPRSREWILIVNRLYLDAVAVADELGAEGAVHDGERMTDFELPLPNDREFGLGGSDPAADTLALDQECDLGSLDDRDPLGERERRDRLRHLDPFGRATVVVPDQDTSRPQRRVGVRTVAAYGLEVVTAVEEDEIERPERGEVELPGIGGDEADFVHETEVARPDSELTVRGHFVPLFDRTRPGLAGAQAHGVDHGVGGCEGGQIGRRVACSGADFQDVTGP